MTEPATYLYVAESRNGGSAFGTAADLDACAARLRIHVVYSVHVRCEAVKEIEGELQRLLKVEPGESRIRRTVTDVRWAIDRAVDLVRRREWVDPHLTDDEARRLRIRLATGENKSAMTLLAKPDKADRLSVRSIVRATGGYRRG